MRKDSVMTKKKQIKKRKDHQVILSLLLMFSVLLFLNVVVANRKQPEEPKKPAYQEKFIKEMVPYAEKSHQKLGILPSIALAQAILESDWGQSQLAIDAYNLFGVKGEYKGMFVSVPTKEFENDKWIEIMDDFRKYPSFQESFDDHAALLNSKYYRTVKNAKDYKEAALALQTMGYATDPNYAEKLIEMIETYELYQYDKK